MTWRETPVTNDKGFAEEITIIVAKLAPKRITDEVSYDIF